MRRRLLLGGLAAALALGGVAACGNDREPVGTPKLDVVAGFYMLQFVAERVGGPHVAVTGIAQPGAEPHDMELKPSQILRVGEADLVLYLNAFQPQLDEAVELTAQGESLDVSAVIPLRRGETHSHEGEEPQAQEGAVDPHFWLDPTRLATVTEAIGARLAEKDPANAADYRKAASELQGELAALDAEFAAGLKTCARREIVTSHAAFGYLAERYQLDQIGLTGLSPEDEPTPQRLTEVAQEAKEHGATTIFFEPLVSPRVAETLAREAGAKTAVLDPVEGLAAGSTEDYFSVMRANLKALREALGCR